MEKQAVSGAMPGIICLCLTDSLLFGVQLQDKTTMVSCKQIQSLLITVLAKGPSVT
jgi:hypothetical protein